MFSASTVSSWMDSNSTFGENETRVDLFPPLDPTLLTPALIPPFNLDPEESNNIFLNFQRMSSNTRNCVIAYILLFLVGASGNLTIFITVGSEIWRRQLLRSRIKVLIWNLATADLFVCFVVIPIEVFWRLTLQWYGGDLICRVSQFLRAFGLYLSSMVIICISLDRFFAIVFPLKVIGGMRRVRHMLWMAWISSLLFATPQLFVFSVQSSVYYPSFYMCTSQRYFTSLEKEILYNMISLGVMYFAPLTIIIVTYTMVLYKVIMKAREHNHNSRIRIGSDVLRRSDNALTTITRARRRALWLSMIIVTIFVLCWSPYVIMTMWYMLDFETADRLVDPRVRDALFVTAVSNSCMNPIIYGNYMKKYWKNLTKLVCSCSRRDRNRRSPASSSLSSAMVRSRCRTPIAVQFASVPHIITTSFGGDHAMHTV